MKTERFETIVGATYNGQKHDIVIDRAEKVKENTNTFIEGFNGDFYWDSVHNCIMRIGNTTKYDFKIIAATPALPNVLMLPEREDEVDVENLADNFVLQYWKERLHNSHRTIQGDGWLATGFVYGYKQATETKRYSEEDMRKCWAQAIANMVVGDNNVNGLKVMNFKNFLQSLNQQQDWYFEPELDANGNIQSTNGYLMGNRKTK